MAETRIRPLTGSKHIKHWLVTKGIMSTGDISFLPDTFQKKPKNINNFYIV
jgi:hypothetical protein